MSPGDYSDTLNVVQKIYRLFLPDYVWYVFIMLLGFYILLRALILSLDGNAWCGNVTYTLHYHCCRHNVTLCIPPIAGMVGIVGEFVGCCRTALFVALQIMSNDPQMSYYFSFCQMLFMAMAYGVFSFEGKANASVS